MYLPNVVQNTVLGILPNKVFIDKTNSHQSFPVHDWLALLCYKPPLLKYILKQFDEVLFLDLLSMLRKHVVLYIFVLIQLMVGCPSTGI